MFADFLLILYWSMTLGVEIQESGDNISLPLQHWQKRQYSTKKSIRVTSAAVMIMSHFSVRENFWVLVSLDVLFWLVLHIKEDILYVESPYTKCSLFPFSEPIWNKNSWNPVYIDLHTVKIMMQYNTIFIYCQRICTGSINCRAIGWQVLKNKWNWSNRITKTKSTIKFDSEFLATY